MGKRKAGFFAKLLGTVGWGMILATIAWWQLPPSWLGFKKPPLATFFLIGLSWPLVWAFFWLCRLALPMPFELGPRLFELFLVGPGHFAAWVIWGKSSEEAPSKDSGKEAKEAKEGAAESAPAAPAPAAPPPAEAPPPPSAEVSPPEPGA